MQSIKSSGSKIEIKIGKAIWKKGFRYRKNDKTVFGKPDFTLKKYKLAIFADSEFWHGKNWRVRKYDHKSNKKFWIKKIEGNIKRDKLVNKTLKRNGWIVLRFWGKEIENNLDKCISIFEKKINEIKRKNVN